MIVDRYFVLQWSFDFFCLVREIVFQRDLPHQQNNRNNERPIERQEDTMEEKGIVFEKTTIYEEL